MPDVFSADAVPVLRLHLGRLQRGQRSSRDPKQQEEWARTVYRLLQQIQPYSGELAAIADAIQCSHDLAAPRAVVSLQLRREPAALQRAQAISRQRHWQVGEFRVPATLELVHQPPGSVAILLQHPPIGFARQGLTQCVLAAAGYTSEVQVLAEFAGGDQVMGDAEAALPQVNTVVAWVRPPAGDQFLRQLPRCL